MMKDYQRTNIPSPLKKFWRGDFLCRLVTPHLYRIHRVMMLIHHPFWENF